MNATYNRLFNSKIRPQHVVTLCDTIYSHIQRTDAIAFVELINHYMLCGWLAVRVKCDSVLSGCVHHLCDGNHFSLSPFHLSVLVLEPWSVGDSVGAGEQTFFF